MSEHIELVTCPHCSTNNEPTYYPKSKGDICPNCGKNIKTIPVDCDGNCTFCSSYEHVDDCKLVDGKSIFPTFKELLEMQFLK